MRSLQPRRRRARSFFAVLAAVALAGTAAPGGHAAENGRLADTVPSTATPNVSDGTVHAFAQVGGKIVVAGTFGKVADRGSSTEVTRTRLFAIDPATGKVDKELAPDIEGTGVYALQPGPNDHTVYIGGKFTSVDGTKRRNLALLDTGTGEVVDGFEPPAFDATVRSLHKGADRLLVGGVFAKAGSATRKGLASVHATTGALDDYLDIPLEGHHNWTGEPGQAKGAVGATAIDVSPDGSSLVVVGNFTSADGAARDQVARVDLGASSASVDSDWATSRFEATCNDKSFDGYLRDVGFSPDGEYFAVVTTGGYDGPDGACDAAFRFDAADTGDDVAPAWAAYSGADTLLGVQVTETAVYVGGHISWMNNPLGRASADPGAVPRPSIAALDPRNGVPMSWNPGRHPRGVGARAFLATSSGLYVGGDTNYIGNYEYRRGKFAFFPFDGGNAVPDETPPALPGTVYLARSGDGEAVQRSFDGTTAGADEDVAGTGSWSSVRGTFQVGDTLYYGLSDDTLRKRSFDGTDFGSVTTVDPYNDPAWSDVRTGTGDTTYRGEVPSFYGQLSDVTAMVYRDGRLYYTLSNEPGLFWRSFSPDSGIVHETEHEASSASRWDVAGGMFLDGDTLYFGARTSGNLYKTAWADGKPEGTLTKVSGPDVDGRDWRTRSMFLRSGS